MSNVNDYRDLEVWKKSIALASKMQRISNGFPREELFGLTSQIRRSAVSIPANIAEGAERNGTKEYIQFLGIARGSAAELETLIVLAEEFRYLTGEQLQPLMEELQAIRKMLSGLMRSLRSKC